MKGVLTNTARKLRNNLTEAEKYLWYFLRFQSLGVKFRRQSIIGQYIVDFVCFERKLIVEVDGGQHYEEHNQIEDKKREEELWVIGFRIIRYTNLDILKNLDNVVRDIFKILPNPPL